MAWTLPRPLPGGGWGIVNDTTGKTYDFDDQALAERTYNILTSQSNDGRGAYVGSGAGATGGYTGFNVAGGTAFVSPEVERARIQASRERGIYIDLPDMETRKQVAAYTAAWTEAQDRMRREADRSRALGYVSGYYPGAPEPDTAWRKAWAEYAPRFGLDADYRTPGSKEFLIRR